MERRDPLRAALNALAKALCVPLPLRLAWTRPASPIDENTELQPYDRATLILQGLVEEPGQLPDAAVDQILEALTLFEAARSTLATTHHHKDGDKDAGHTAVEELARHLDEGGASVDADTEAWLLKTTVPAGLSRGLLFDDSFKKRTRLGRHSGEEGLRSKAKSNGVARSGGMKRIMTAPTSLADLAPPGTSPPNQRPSGPGVLRRAGTGVLSLGPNEMDEAENVEEEVSRNSKSAEPLRRLGAFDESKLPNEGPRLRRGTNRDESNGQLSAVHETALVNCVEGVPETPSTHELMASPFFTATDRRWRFAASVAPTLRAASLGWEYDVVALDAASNAHGLTSLFHELLRRHDLLHRLEEEGGLVLDVVKLAHFLQHIEETYGANPYRTQPSRALQPATAPCPLHPSPAIACLHLPSLPSPAAAMPAAHLAHSPAALLRMS